jgi:hypothetical protein
MQRWIFSLFQHSTVPVQEEQSYKSVYLIAENVMPNTRLTRAAIDKFFNEKLVHLSREGLQSMIKHSLTHEHLNDPKIILSPFPENVILMECVVPCSMDGKPNLSNFQAENICKACSSATIREAELSIHLKEDDYWVTNPRFDKNLQSESSLRLR